MTTTTLSHPKVDHQALQAVDTLISLSAAASTSKHAPVLPVSPVTSASSSSSSSSSGIMPQQGTERFPARSSIKSEAMLRQESLLQSSFQPDSDQFSRPASRKQSYGESENIIGRKEPSEYDGASVTSQVSADSRQPSPSKDELESPRSVTQADTLSRPPAPPAAAVQWKDRHATSWRRTVYTDRAGCCAEAMGRQHLLSCMDDLRQKMHAILYADSPSSPTLSRSSTFSSSSSLSSSSSVPRHSVNNRRTSTTPTPTTSCYVPPPAAAPIPLEPVTLPATFPAPPPTHHRYPRQIQPPSKTILKKSRTRTTRSTHQHPPKFPRKIKPFVCACGASFGQRSHLTAHISTVHYKERNYKCEICDFRFGTKSNLNSHIAAVHYRIKKFECRVCQCRFAKSSNLKKHLFTVHHLK